MLNWLRISMPKTLCFMKNRIIKALELCAKSHKVEINVYDEDPEDVQVALMSTSIPVVTDVKMIAEAFYGQSYPVVHVDNSWGFVDLLLDCRPMLKKVNEGLLKMALPSGSRV